MTEELADQLMRISLFSLLAYLLVIVEKAQVTLSMALFHLASPLTLVNEPVCTIPVPLNKDI